MTATLDSGWEPVVIVSQNFKLLNQRKNRPDPIVVRRFRKLCWYLDRNRDRFEVAGFTGPQKTEEHLQPALTASSRSEAHGRSAEQLLRQALG